MLTEAASAVSGIKAAYDMASALVGMATDQKVKMATMDLMSSILAAQQQALAAQDAYAALQKRTAELEGELSDRNAWIEEQAKYRLQTFSTGVQAYVPKDPQPDEGAVRLCPNCWGDGRKSILQTIAKVRGGEVVDCPRCKTRLELQESGPYPRHEIPSTRYF
jgi:membrane protease subunit (stomatin/prohibitin family)